MVQEAVQEIRPGAVDYGDGRVVFALYAPGKQSVHLVGSFNRWDPRADPMEAAPDGLWWIEKALPPGPSLYQFVVDGRTTICDPYARALAQGSEYDPPRAVVDVGRKPFTWRNDHWKRPAFQDLILYEIHVGDFTPQRSFRAVIQKLDYLEDLGVNAMELMPVFEFVGEEASWGYDPTYFFTVETDYGSADDLRALVDEAHGRGIAVILDIVLAHTSTKHPFRKLYTEEESPWYGKGFGEKNRFGFPMLDYSKPATQDFVRDVISYWTHEYHIDGFRFDYLIGIGAKDGMGVPFLVRSAREQRPDLYLIGEYSPEEPEAANESGLDGCWHVAVRYALMTLLRQGKLNEYDWNDFERVFGFFDPRNQGYRHRFMAVNYLETHDEWRAFYEFISAGFSYETAFVKSALAAAVLFTIPGQPMLYHGQEWGEPTECTLRPNPIHWENLEKESARKLRDRYRQMARLRREHPALRSENFSIDAIHPDLKSVAYRRWSDDADQGQGDHVVVAVNFSPIPQTMEVPFRHAGTWRDVLSGEAVEARDSLSVRMEPLSARIFIR